MKNKRYRCIRLAIYCLPVVAMVLFVACEDSLALNTVYGQKIGVSSVLLSPNSAEIAVGSSITLSPAILPGNATDVDIEWSSSDESVATVNTEGLVNGISAGTATITATTGTQYARATIAVTADIPGSAMDEGIILDKKKASVVVGYSVTLLATVLPASEPNRSVAWSTSSPFVATVNDRGLVTGVGSGTATITATSSASGAVATCVVAVLATAPISVASVTVAQLTNLLLVGTIIQLDAIITPSNSTAEVTWNSTDINVAEVSSSGLVTGVGRGTVSISATADGKTASCIFSVQYPVSSVATGSAHTMILTSDGSLWATGNNQYGQLGDGTTIDVHVPIRIMTGVASVAAGGYHTMIVKTDGSLWATGLNDFGQLGTGTSVASIATPMQIMTGVSAVSAGNASTLILKFDHSLWATGRNFEGELGNGTNTSISVPVQIMADVLSVSAGAYHTMILKSGGILWATGFNLQGQLGNGTTADLSSPAQVMTNVATVIAGGNHTMVVKNDASLWTFGYNAYGQLGNGSVSYESPQPAQIVPVVASIAAGGAHSMIVHTDGSLWATGRNDNGQLGNGTWVSISTPTQIMTDVASVVAGDSHTIIIKNDGSVWATGANWKGQLGNDSTSSIMTPVRIF